MRRSEEISSINLGFQMAPMIDIVFVLLLFFMAMAGAVKMEREIRTAMPGGNQEKSPWPDDITIALTEDGAVTMNEEEYDSSANKKRRFASRNG